MPTLRRISSLFAVLSLLVSLAGCLDLDPAHYRFTPAEDSGAGTGGGAGGGGGGSDGGRVDGGSGDGGIGSCSVTCVPASPVCTNSSTLTTMRVRACTGSACQFETSTVLCSQGCANGACVNEPCAGVSCSEPPPSTCVNATSLRVFTSPGACTAGTCGYASAEVSCSGGCSNGACTGNPCAGRVCNLPPASSCVGNVLRTYSSQGICDGASGACTYQRVDTVCVAGCSNAACVADPCSGVTCNTPPASTCVSGTVRQTFGATGVCSVGSCSYTPLLETCTSGKQCQGGECVTPPPTCNSTNCATGCCSGSTCVAFANQSTSACGTQGNACLACSGGGGFECKSGSCSDVNECQINNGGCHANANCSNTVGSRTCRCKPGYSGDGIITCVATDAGPAYAWKELRDGGSAADPASRRSAMMVYDTTDGVTVMFGGFNGSSTHYGDTYSWDGARWFLETNVGPEPRRLAAAAYDSTRGVMVLFGGYDNTNVMADTWEWNGSAWTERLVSGPTRRYGAAATYDSNRKKVVMFGGKVSPSATAELAETWEWDGTSWLQRLPTDSPGGLFSPTLAFDSVRNRVVLFGGTAGTAATVAAKTWEYDGTTWSLLASTGPSGRYGAIGGFMRGKTVIFGGYDYSNMFNDTWEWDGAVWTERLFSGPVPFSRFYASGAVDTDRGRLVMYGGGDVGSGVTYKDVWELGPR